ncbi:MAG TPA: protein YgfX [Methylophilaceae bacterium]|nr:protein YgfX [Methylophilaceae bacterium]
MHHYNVKPIRLALQPSYLLAVVLAGAALGACIIVAWMPLSLWLKLLLCLAIAVSAAYHIAAQALLLLPGAWLQLELNSLGELQVSRKDGLVKSAVVLESSFVAAYLSILNLRISGSRWQANLIITPDRVDSTAFRQLRIWLRWGRQAVSEAALDEA